MNKLRELLIDGVLMTLPLAALADRTCQPMKEELFALLIGLCGLRKRRAGACDGLPAVVHETHVRHRPGRRLCGPVVAELQGLSAAAVTRLLQPRSRVGSGDEAAEELTPMGRTTAQPNRLHGFAGAVGVLELDAYSGSTMPRRLLTLFVALVAWAFGPGAVAQPVAAPKGTGQPNIVFVLTDNLGYGEVGAYGGGATRGAPTPRIDSLAKEGMRFLNFNMETQCTPSRSSLMTGRWAVRSGTHSVPFGGVADGLTRWEVTIGEALSDAGYATGYYGKWHLGSHDGRLPNDQGFDEWFGIPRTTDEALWPSSPGWSADIMPAEQMMEGRKGEKSRPLGVYDVTQRRLIDAEITRRAVSFIGRQAQAGKPFFAYVSLTQPHLPTEPNPAFKGRTGNGDWADMLAEMDAKVGQMLDAVDKAGIRDNTIFIFTSDNGPEYIRPWDGWAGPWRGQYFTALEGGIRVPFMIRWPGKIAAARESNEIVHGVDMFATLARFGGAKVPADRPFDSIDQADFFLGKTDKSAREGFPIWCADRLQAVKWRNWKLHFYRQDSMFDPPVRNPVPTVYNLYTDPREEKPTPDSWVVGPVLKIVGEFERSMKQHPLIPMGTPDPYRPGAAPQ